MASAKEIKTRINSIQDTMKITNAMYMISSSKMQRAKRTLADTEPFFFAQQEAAARCFAVTPDVKCRYFGREKEEADKVRGYIVITGDKGLAGAYNQNILKLAQQHMAEHPNNRLYVIGELGRHYFQAKGLEVDENFRYTVQDPTLFRAREIAGKMIDKYNEGELDEVYVVYTRMINAFRMDAEIKQLLPLDKEALTEIDVSKYKDLTTFHPSVEEVLNNLIPNIVSGYLYGTLVEDRKSVV